MTTSKTVTANIICMKKLIPNPCQILANCRGKKASLLISATISVNGLRAKLSALEGAVGSDREATRGHGTRVSASPAMHDLRQALPSLLGNLNPWRWP